MKYYKTDCGELIQFNPETTGFYDYSPRLETNKNYNPDAFIEQNNYKS